MAISPHASVMMSNLKDDSPVMYLDGGIMVAGTGFLPYEPLEVRLDIDGTKQGVVGLGFTTANGAGSWSLMLEKLKNRASIIRTQSILTATPVIALIAEGADGSKASTPVRAAAQAPFVPGPPPPLGAAVTVGTVAQGESTTILGSGFEPGELVDFLVINAVGYSRGKADVVQAEKPVGSSLANDSGVVEATLKVVTRIPEGVTETVHSINPGIYTLLAKGSSGRVASTVLIVVKPKQ